MKTGEILDQILQIGDEFSPVATESVGCNIPTTADGPDTIPLQGNLYSWLNSEVNSNEKSNEELNEELSDLLYFTRDFEQLENIDFSFDLAQLESDEVSPWRPDYQAFFFYSLSFG